ncbi:MAG: DUF2577 domain-containing protein [Oscillospiraceae bacterium]|jgi:hypothetical protein|nr:DUF2577 domain-containing protein [Oscillospiraceae bacterium]
MSEMSLKRAIQGLNQSGASVKIGIVRSGNPLLIALQNDGKVTLGERSLCVPQHLRDYGVKLSIPSLSLSADDATVHGALQSGEKVYLVCLEKEKKYVVIGRVVA